MLTKGNTIPIMRGMILRDGKDKFIINEAQEVRPFETERMAINGALSEVKLKSRNKAKVPKRYKNGIMVATHSLHRESGRKALENSIKKAKQ